MSWIYLNHDYREKVTVFICWFSSAGTTSVDSLDWAGRLNHNGGRINSLLTCDVPGLYAGRCKFVDQVWRLRGADGKGHKDESGEP